MEKSLFAQTGEIKGKQEEGHLTASFQFIPGEENLKETRGSLFALVEINEPSKDKALQEARRIFVVFKNAFYGARGNNLKALEEALLAFENEKKEKGLKVEIVAGILWGSVLYVGKVGSGAVILSRKNQAKKIDFSRLASGNLLDRDSIFLIDSGFAQTTDLESLALKAGKDDFEESLEDIGLDRGELVGGGLCIRLSIQEPIEKPQPLLIADLDKEGEYKKPASEEAKKLLRAFSFSLAPIKNKIDQISPQIKTYIQNATVFVKAKTKVGITYLISPWLPRQPGEIGDEASRKKKKAVQLAAVLGTILIISVVFGVVNHQRNQNKERLEQGISFVEDNFSEAEKLKDINPAKAASLVLEAEEKLGQLPAGDSKVVELREKLERLLAAINKIYSPKTKEFADLSLVKGGVDAKKIKLAGGSIFVLDGGTGSVFKLNLKKAEPEIFISEEQGLQNIGVTDQFLYLQTADSIKRVDLSTKTKQDVASASKDWQNLSSARTYRGNLYLLDSKARQIWKYLPAATALSGPQAYLKQPLGSEPVAFAIDSAIYVSDGSGVLKFFGGQKVGFEIKNLPRAISKITDIFTQEGTNGLYVLDKERGALFVINKQDGEYKGLYLNDKLKDAKSIVVNEAGKRVYFLAGNTIYSFKLQ